MADATVVNEAYIPLKALGGGKLVAHIGNATWDAYDSVTNELPTDLANIREAIITPGGYVAAAAVGAQVMSCDRTVSSDKVTIERKVTGDTSGGGPDTFSFVLIGEIT